MTNEITQGWIAVYDSNGKYVDDELSVSVRPIYSITDVVIDTYNSDPCHMTVTHTPTNTRYTGSSRNTGKLRRDLLTKLERAVTINDFH